LLLVLGLVLAFGIIPERTEADDANANAIAAGLQDFASFADTLAGFEELGETIPFTDLDPSADDALRLSSLFQDSFASLPASFADLGDLESALEGLDDPNLGGTGIAVTFGSPSGPPVQVIPDNPSAPVLIDVVLPFEATRTVPVPLAFESEVVDLSGGSLSLTFELTTALQFQLDTTALATPAEAFYIVDEPTIGVSATADGSIETITAPLGFAEVEATGTAILNIDIEIAFDDPDDLVDTEGNLRITVDEFTSTSVEDLLDVAFVDADTDAVDVAINLDTTLISGPLPTGCTAGDACIVLVDGDITDGLDAPTFHLGELADFRNFTAADALLGLERLVIWLNSLQSTGRLDVELPLVGGTFSDIGTGVIVEGAEETLSIAKALADAAAALRYAEDPTFDDALELGQDLADALGLSGYIVPVYTAGPPPTLTYQFVVEDSATSSVPLDFRGELDVLSGIEISWGGETDLTGAYKLDLTFGLDLTAQPTEDGAGVGSCEDGIDNGDGDGIDAGDTDCAILKTIEQRVFLDVGTGAGSDELVARLALVATGVDATASIGLLEASIENASLKVGSNKEEDGAGVGTCEDGIDNGHGDEDGDTVDDFDADDPDCTFVTIDLYESGGDGYLTIEDLFNTMGGSPPAGATLDADLSAKIDATIPVEATLGGSPLVSGNILVTGSFDSACEPDPGEACWPDLFDFVNSISIDASGLGDLLNFSPCSNDEDDDGDGKINDGCPVVDTGSQPGDGPDCDANDNDNCTDPGEDALCDNADDDDGDGKVNDGCPALADSEVESLALLDQIVALLQALADEIDELEGPDVGSTLSDPLPLVGTSFRDLLSYADALDDLVDELLAVGEDPATECGLGDTVDDDHDGMVNDGCPTQDDVPEAGAQCRNDTDDEDNDVATDGKQSDDYINDGCSPSVPTLQDLEDQIAQTLEDVLDSLPGVDAPATTVGLVISLDSDDDLSFELDAHVVLSASSTFNLDLSDLGGDLAGVDMVALESTGGFEVALTADLDLDFGLDLDDFEFFLLGSTGLTLTAQADAEDIDFNVSIAGLTVSAGTDTAEAETACNDAVDDDEDGKINDGCPQEGDDPESGADCDNDEDDDDDTKVNDGCYPGGVADKVRGHLGASFDIEVDGDSSNKIVFADLDSTDFDEGDGFDGVDQSECPTTTDHACAVLPLYFEGLALGTPPGHHVTLRITDITNLNTIALGYPGLTDLEDIIAGQLLDMLLLESGLSRFLDVVASLVDGEIFGFDLPLVGDQLDEAAAFISTLDDELVTAVHDGSDPDPFDGLGSTPDADDVKGALETFAQGIGQAIIDNTDPDLLLDTDGDGDQDKFDVVVKIFCDDVEDCGIGPESGAQCSDGVPADDDDEDGKYNDGCPAYDPSASEDGAGAGTGNDTTDNDSDGADYADDDCLGSGAETGTDCADNVDNDSDGYVNDGCYPGGFNPPASEVDEVRFYARLGQSATFSASPSFDIGIPGLGLSSDGSVSVTPTWSVFLGFGVSKEKGFFLVTDGTSESGVACTDGFGVDDDGNGLVDDGCPELTVGADVTLPPQIEGVLGFLKVTIIDGDPEKTCAEVGSGTDTPCRPEGDTEDVPSSFNPKFVIDLLDPGTGASDDGRLTFAEMTSAPAFDRVIEYDFSAVADINLHIELSIEGEATLPKLIADLHIDWHWSLTNESDADALEDNTGTSCIDDADNCFEIKLDNLVVDAGTFLSKFLGPVFDDVKQYTEPLQPIIDALNEPIPVLTELSGSPVTLLTLCESLCPGDSNLDLIIYIVKLVSFINDIKTPPGGDLTIPIGDGTFILDGQRLQSGPLASSQAGSAFEAGQLSGLSSLLGSFDSKLPDGLSSGEVQNTSGLQSIGVSFPFLEHPEQLLMMLFGQDVDLVLWTPPPLQAGFSYSMKFGPIWALPPVFLEVGGSVSITGRFGLGYDTQGIREVLFEEADEWSLLNGLFLVDRWDGQDLNELELRGEIFANAQISVIIFSAGAGGSIYLTIGIDLQDPNNNGKLKFQEVATILEATANPFCLFILNGKFGVRIYVFVEVDLFFWSKRWEETLADIVILSFQVQCDFNKVPVLASDAGGGVLLLHMGPNSDMRGSGSVGYAATAEEFRVTQEGDGSLTVTAFGYSQNWCKPGAKDGPPPCGGWTQVVADAGHSGDPSDDEDVISLLDGAKGAETKCANGDAVDDDGDGFINDGCPAQDKIEEGTQCQNAVDDDEDIPADGLVNDGCPTVGELVPFTVPADLWGGAGDDKITGGNGDDKINGGSQNDTIIGRLGNDDIIGGIGNDQISGGPGDDDIYGDSAAGAAGGSISWDSCGTNAPQTGFDGNDTIQAGLGEDRVCGQGGDDTLTGGISNASAVGDGPESGSQCGNNVDDDVDDVIDDGCLDAADEIHGGSGSDDIIGGDGGDTLHGDGDPDHIDGGKGDDTIYGGDESSPGDVIVGGPGSDTIYGGDGDDIIIGGNLIQGEPDVGDARLDGEGDNDTILGDNATFTDSVFTLIDPDIGGADNMYGGSGEDVMRGQRGDDTMWGGNGDDDMRGNDGNDTMHGGANDDDMQGNDGNDTMNGDAGGDDMFGNAGIDTMHGDGGDDYMRGGTQDDTMYGDANDDEMYGDSGKDTMYGGDDMDYMRGGIGEDTMEGNGGADEMYGDAGQDDMIGGSSTAGAEDDEQYVVGLGNIGDRMYGNARHDVMAGDNAQITRPDGTNPDGSVKRSVTLYDLGCDVDNEAGNDIMSGGHGNDDMYGGGENDTMHGNAGDDYLEGNCADDEMYGDAGQDDLIGGTSQNAGGVPDGGDTMYGGSNSSDLLSDFDVLAGDNASIVRPVDGGDWITDDFSAEAIGVVRRVVTLYDVGEVDPPAGTGPAGTGTSGGDDMFGEGGFDIMYGQGGNENEMRGGTGDDYMEGNDGADEMYGDQGQDDLIGGTGRTKSDDPSTAEDGRLDGSDTIYGGDGAGGVADNDYDVIMGDNATIDRPLDAEGKWQTNTFNAAVKRIIRLYDVGEVDPPAGTGPAGTGTSGGDTLYGEANDDVMYGQGADDTMSGGPGDDYMEGNDGSDTMTGEDGNDDMAGGTGRINDDPPEGTDGRLDAGEVNMTGGNGFDFMAGDNAIIVRVLVEGKWVPNTFNDGIQHERIVLLDINSSDMALVSGGDTMFGDDDDDVMYGQGNGADEDGDDDGRIDEDPADSVDNDGDGSIDEDAGGDVMHGNNAEDYMEGNHGADFMYGDSGQDDMIGGTGRVGDDPEDGVDGRLDGDDTMFGESDTSEGTADGDGADAMTGDNAIIVRPLVESGEHAGQWQINTFNGQFTRMVRILDVQDVGDDPLVSPDVSGNDHMWGNSNDDIMYGQGGEDEMHGNAGDDYMEGNAASDLMYGEGGDDDMVGGSGPMTSSSQLQELSEDDRATALPGRTDESTRTRNVPFGTGDSVNPYPTQPVPLGDEMYGGEGADVMLGDNGIIIRPLEANQWITLTYALQKDSDGTEAPRHPTEGSGWRIERTAEMIDEDPGEVAGSDEMYGGPGDDDMYGQFDDTHQADPAIGDEMYGEDGEDAMAGDQGLFNNWVITTATQHIEPKEPFIDDDIFIENTLFREFVLEQIEIGGDDRMRGGPGGDWMHGGAGEDVMNGDDGNDRMFGDNGDDDMWGGRQHDHLWGGYGFDQLDLHPRVDEDDANPNSCNPLDPPDPSVWYEFAFEGGLGTTTCDGNFEDVDYIYGGWDADAMQANVGDNGPRVGDRLMDWAGVYNLFVLCPATYGEFVSTRESSPHMTDFIHRLAEGDGAFQPGPEGKKGAPTDDSGFNEIAFVYKKDIKFNANPPYEDTPAHFTCTVDSVTIP